MADNKALVQKLGEWPAGIKNYFQDLQTEMRRVTWPSRSQVQATTIVVIATVFAFAAYFALVDAVFTSFIGKLFQTFAKQS